MSAQAVLAAARAQIEREAQAVADLANQLDLSFVQFAQHVSMMQGKLFVLGCGTSGMIAARMAHLLSVTGTPALTLDVMDCLHGSMGAITPADTVLAVSKGGESDELNQLVKLLRKQGVTVYALTESPQSTFSQLATAALVVKTPNQADPGNVIAMASTVMIGAWGDALAYVLMRAKNRQWEQTLGIHPAGAVGKQTHLPEPLAPLDLK